MTKTRTTILLEEPIRRGLGHMAIDNRKTKTQILNEILTKELKEKGYLES